MERDEEGKLTKTRNWRSPFSETATATPTPTPTSCLTSQSPCQSQMDCNSQFHYSTSSSPHFDSSSGISKTQAYNCFAGKNDGYGIVPGVPTAPTGKSSSVVAGIPSFGSEGTDTVDIHSKCSEFHNSLMESSKVLLEQLLQLIPFHVGRVMDSQGMKPYGRVIVDKGSGLPLIIKFVGKALRMDGSMTASLHEVRGLLSTKTLHQVLKFGYDRLEKHGIKSCFLYSALCTASKAVSFAALVDSMIDEGFIAGGMSDARKRGHDFIKHLAEIYFLQCTDDGLMVKVHDLLCDMALEILSDVEGSQMLLSRYLRFQKSPLVYSSKSSDQPACSEGPKSSSSGHFWILKVGEGLTKPPSEEEWEEAKMVLLMDNKLSSLPKRPTCSTLHTLFLQRNTCLRAIPPHFFENMSSLRILNLSKTRIKSLPQSLSRLVWLQVFIIRNCERLLFLPSEIRDLRRLLVLDVHGTEICKLPDEVGELHCLVHLQVHFYGSMDEDEIMMLPPLLMSKGLISKLAQLRELSIIVYPGDPRWTDIASDITIEVSNLKALCSMSFHFPEISHLEHFITTSPAWLHKELTQFNLIVGRDVKRIVSHVSDELEHDYNQQDRCIRFVNGEDIPDAVEEVLSLATAFYLDHHLTAHSLTQFGWAAINDLKFCIVRDCPKLEAILNNKEMIGKCLPFLNLLSIHYAWNLSQIWVGPIQAGSLSMLRRLSIHCCPKLEFILSHSMVAVLYKLEELIIEDCQSLKYVIGEGMKPSFDDGTSDGYSTEGDVIADLNAIEYDEQEVQNQMEFDLSGVKVHGIKVLKLHYLPKLENIWKDGDGFPCLENLSVYNCPRLKKLDLKSQVEVTMKKIKVDMAWWRDLKWDDPALPPKLEHCVEEINGDDIWGTM